MKFSEGEQLNGQHGLYRRDNFAAPASYTLISDPSAPPVSATPDSSEFDFAGHRTPLVTTFPANFIGQNPVRQTRSADHHRHPLLEDLHKASQPPERGSREGRGTEEGAKSAQQAPLAERRGEEEVTERRRKPAPRHPDSSGTVRWITKRPC